MKKLFLLCIAIMICVACSIADIGMVNASNENDKNYTMNTSSDVSDEFFDK